METEPQLVPPTPPRPPAAPAPDAPLGPARDEPQPFQEPRKRRGGVVGTALVAIVAFLSKFKALLLLLPKVKLLATSGSMLVSVAAYSLIWGWTFAIGVVLLLFIHELGHVIQFRREGIPVTAMLFIPLLGAVVGGKRMPDDAAAEARIGLAGPLLGSVGAAVCLVPYALTHDDFWRALAFVGFFLNLINLLPVLPLDGGRAMAALSPRMWFIGFAALVGLVFVWPNPIFVLILILGGMETWRRWKQRKDPAHQAYYNISPAARAYTAVVYVGLIAALAYGMHVSHLVRHFSDA